MNKQKKEDIQTIKRLWNKAEYVLNNKSWTKYGTNLLKENRKESKNHDSARPYNIKRGLNITEEAKFFAIKRLCLYLYDLDKPPSLENYNHHLKSLYSAYSLSQEFKKELKEVISLQSAKYLNGLDYVKLIKVIQ